MRIIIDINTDGAAYQDDAMSELLNATRKMCNGILLGHTEGSAYDPNGNTFVRWERVED